MCGITGIVNLDNKPIERDILKGMTEAQRHRGPDDFGTYADKNVGLGHVRLSIIDLSKEAHQPMPNEDSSLIVVHNGEIYNYLELKTDLEGRGHRFRSRSDTEVILHAYEEWGEFCVKYFNGMWSFAILDLRKNVIFCSRDRLGVKPFYYYHDNETFIFASEIKALLRHPKIKRQANDKTVFSYLYSGYGYMDISDDTFFNGIKQLKPAHYMKLPINGKGVSQVRYWEIDPRKKAAFSNEEDVYKRFYDLLEDSIRLRMRSDVPLGVSLSGGLDSSSIACIAALLLKGGRLETFSSCFEEETECDERRFIQPVLDRTGAHANFVFSKSRELFSEIENIIWYQDEPYSTLSIFPQWYIMKMARDKGVKVLLNGQGGDEILGGYHKYYLYLFADLVYSLKWDKAIKEINLYKEMKGSNKNIADSVTRIILSYITPSILKKSFNQGADKNIPEYLNKDFILNNSNKLFPERRFSSILNNDLYNALKVSPLPSLLHIDDRSGMANAVESRAPFLDYRLIEYAFSLGPEYKIRDGLTKHLLRRSLKGVLPQEIVSRTDKMGFATPLERWFKRDLKNDVYDIISSKEFSRRPYFNQKKAMEKFENFIQGREKNAHYTIWSWVNLELWLRKFIDEK